MKTIEIQLYKFSELSEDAKQTAIEKLSDANKFYEWWEGVYDDAENVGIKITGFDLDRNKHASGKLTGDFLRVITLIRNSHGETCETYKTADQYLKQYNDLVGKYSDGINTNVVTEENEYDFDQEADELENEFLEAILSDYADILETEYEYLTSEAAIIETIEANDYDFTEDGKRY